MNDRMRELPAVALRGMTILPGVAVTIFFPAVKATMTYSEMKAMTHISGIWETV